MDDGLEWSRRVGLFRKGVRFLDAGQIADECRAGARHRTHSLSSTVLVAPMQDDVMAHCHEALRGAPSKAITGARDEDTCHDTGLLRLFELARRRSHAESVDYARLSSSTGIVRMPAVWRSYSAKP